MPTKSGQRWTLERVQRRARGYTYLNDFIQNDWNAYKAAWRNGWLNKLGLKKKDRKQRRKWTWSRIEDVAKTCSSRSELSRVARGAYAIAQNMPGDVLTDLGLPAHVPRRWSRENVLREAKKYPSRGAFKQGAPGAYDAARKHNWLDACFPKNCDQKR